MTCPAPDAAPDAAPDVLVVLEAAGVHVLVDLADARPPALPYWGAALPGLDEPTARGLVATWHAPAGRNDVDVAARVGLLPEGGTGFPGRPGLEGSREGGRAWSPRFRVTAVTLDGAPVEGYVASGPGVLEVAARDDDSELGLDLVLELEPGGLLRTRATVTNLGGSDYDLASLTLAVPVPAEADELLDLAGRWARERQPQRRAFTLGTHLRENRRGRTGADAATVLHACVPGTGFARGETYAVHTAWSGNHVHYAERTFSGTRLLGGGELLLPGEVRLASGAAYTSPWLYAAHGDGLDEVAARFHAHVRGRAERPVDSERPVTLNVWEAVYFDHDLGRLLDLAERAATLGVERFVLDDGWFGGRRHEQAGLGDWVVSPDVWPDGLHPLVDRVRELGMQFGLWFEPEMVNLDSDVARAHPEWVMGARGDALPPPARFQHVLDLGVPEAYAHVRDQVLAVLDEYDIGYVKWDHNRDLVEGGDLTRGGRPGVRAQTQAYYRLLDEIRERHPGLEIESCASGGGRVDLEVLERTDRVWASDCIDPLERQAINRWTAQLLPPEVIGSHVASGRSHTTGRTHDLGFRAATALFGHFGIEWDLAEATDAELAELGAWIELYKSWRGLLLTGRVVRLDTAEPNALVHGVVAHDGSEAVFASVSTGSLESTPGPRTRFRGLDPAATYAVRHVQVGEGPSGIHPPPWWSDQPVLMTGEALHRAGVTPPVVDPDQTVLHHLVRR